MRIFVTVKPGKREDKIEKIDSSHYVVHTKVGPIEGRANTAVISLLSKYFAIPKSLITLKSGLKSRTKVIEIKTE